MNSLLLVAKIRLVAPAVDGTYQNLEDDAEHFLDCDQPPRKRRPGNAVVVVIQQFFPRVFVGTGGQPCHKLVVDSTAESYTLERIVKFLAGLQTGGTRIFFGLIWIQQIFDVSTNSMEFPDQLSKQFCDRTIWLQRIPGVFVFIVSVNFFDDILEETNLTAAGIVLQI
jgi:hypothetical protein